MYNFEVKRKHR